MSLITRMSLKNRLIVGLLTLVIAVFGVIATTSLNQETMPSVELPGTSVQVTVPGASPEVVEESVTKPIETALEGVGDLETVSTTSSAGSMSANVTWPFGKDAEEMTDSVRSAVDSAKADLPDGAEAEVLSQQIDDVPVVMFAVSGGEDSQKLGDLVETELVPELQSVAGVSSVDLAGQNERRVNISFRPDDVNDKNVVTTSVPDELTAAGTVVPAGQSADGNKSLSVEVGDELDAVDQIEKTPLRTADGTVLLGDVADVELDSVDKTSYSRADGKDAVTVSVTKGQDDNVVEVSHRVNEVLERMGPELGDDVSFSTIFDQAPEIEKSIHDLSVEGGLGLFFAILVILAFLGSFRSTVVAAISIPMSLLIAMIGLMVGEYTLNILTLGALTIAVGRVVDDSIVVIENIRRRQGTTELTVDDIVASVKQVAGAITASTLTTVAVFLPIAFVDGIAGQLFRPFSVTVTLALLGSLVVALTIVPVFSYWVLRKSPKPLSPKRQAATDASYEAWAQKHREKGIKRAERRQRTIEKKNAKREVKGKTLLPAATADAPVEPMPGDGEASDRVDRLQQRSLPAILAALRHPWRTIVISVAIFAVTMMMASFLKTDLLGSAGQGSLYISQTLPAGSSLEASDEAAKKIEDVLASDPDVDTYSTTVNGPESGAENSFNITLKTDSDAKAATNRIRSQVESLGEDIGEADVQDASGSTNEDVEIKLAGSDMKALGEAADAVTKKMSETEGVTNARNDLASDQPIIHVDVNREKAADYGYSQAEVGQAIAAALHGSEAGTLTLEGKERDIFLAPTHPDATPDEIRALELPVTEVQTQNAQEDATDAVEEKTDRRADEAKAKAEEESADQLESAREARDNAADQLEEARKALRDAQNPPPAPSPGDMAADQVEQAEEGVEQAEKGLNEANDAIDDLVDSQREQEESQAEEQDLADEQAAIPDIKGDPITVDEIASVDETETPATVTREDGNRQVTVFATPAEGQLNPVSAKAQELTSSMDLPDGVSFDVGGASQEQADSFAQLGWAMLVAIALVFLVMIATFRSFVQPLILLVSIPFAATGAVLLLLLTGTPLGIPSLIGLLMLIGIVVTNAIVLIDLVNKLREHGMGLWDAIIHGTRLRLRPILMTAAATVFALVPMSLGLTGGGVFISQPLAIVVIGGLTSSTVLTLILVPALYLLVERRKERRAEHKEAKAEAKHEADQHRIDEETAEVAARPVDE
ncbi:hydrophobic/amphiphilic exporter-1, HAE1 family [Brevibacterium aurantiacum]|uniref:Hydrophobic/amphiphilic exporter-1, HAE1 family n=2 Tax=Brevibacterium aurantiacum TaxID=273384 RepID=A0A2H1JLT6_BREAU|nr:efflux RND transporter permease subunit [Brevibacterium aurantiacum]SMX88495.1 hydrophobic/amphiphilic exporter-1, HAE1 family [Brevibacterium aurantiacum]